MRKQFRGDPARHVRFYALGGRGTEFLPETLARDLARRFLTRRQVHVRTPQAR